MIKDGQTKNGKLSFKSVNANDLAKFENQSSESEECETMDLEIQPIFKIERVGTPIVPFHKDKVESMSLHQIKDQNPSDSVHTSGTSSPPRKRQR